MHQRRLTAKRQPPAGGSAFVDRHHSLFEMKFTSAPIRQVGCTRPSRRGVTPHQRNPQSHVVPPIWYHGFHDQQLRPDTALEPTSPCCTLVPTHP